MGNELLKIFSDNLNRLMIERGKRQTDLCNDLHIGKATASEWVRGLSMPSTPGIQKLCGYFGCDMDDLLKTPEEAKKVREEYDEFIEMLRTRPECKILFSTMKDATKEDIEQAAKVIEALRK